MTTIIFYFLVPILALLVVAICYRDVPNGPADAPGIIADVLCAAVLAVGFKRVLEGEAAIDSLFAAIGVAALVAALAAVAVKGSKREKKQAKHAEKEEKK